METTQTAEPPALATNILNGIAELCEQAAANSQPLEVDPQRGHLFEYFATAEAAGFVQDDAETDLTADALCRLLGQRWGVADGLQQSVASQEKMNQAALGKMRLLWSLMRMWMEWTYAWQRWDEFHSARTDGPQVEDAAGEPPQSQEPESMERA